MTYGTMSVAAQEPCVLGPWAGSRLRVVDLATGGEDEFDAPSFGASWSPAGDQLAFLGARGKDSLHLMLTKPGGGPVREFEAVARPACVAPQWFPDGRRIALLTWAGARTLSEGPWLDAGLDREAAITEIDVETGRLVVVITERPDFRPAGAVPSPSGRLLAVPSAPIFNSEGRVVHTLLVIDADSGAPRFQLNDLPLGEDLAGGILPWAWLPARDAIILVEPDRAVLADFGGDTCTKRLLFAPPDGTALDPMSFGLTHDGSAIVLMGADGRSGTVVSLDGSEARPFVLDASLPLAPIRGGGRVLWSPRPKAVAFAGGDAMRWEGHLLDLGTGAFAPWSAGWGLSRFAASTGPDGVVVAVRENAATSPSIVVLATENVHAHTVRMVDQTLAEVPAPIIRLVERPNGKRCLLLLPQGADLPSRLPGVVLLYGGALGSRWAARFDGGGFVLLPPWLFTAHGYAVLLADVPLPANVDDCSPLADTAAAVMAQVELAAEEGWIDPRRVAMVGHSYGALGAVGVAAAHADVGAVVAASGCYDLASMHGWPFEGLPEGAAASMVEGEPGRMGQAPWRSPERYLANSPFWQADRIRAPVLLIHGKADLITPWQESARMHAALRRLGRTAELALYENEGHAIREWSPSNSEDAAARVFSFLHQHLSA